MCPHPDRYRFVKVQPISGVDLQIRCGTQEAGPPAYAEHQGATRCRQSVAVTEEPLDMLALVLPARVAVALILGGC